MNDKKKRKTPIQIAVNTYIGNYCQRKCFNHKYLMQDCFKRFERIVREMEGRDISRTEFNAMMKSREIKICKLPFDKRKRWVSWKYFERIHQKNTDFWEMDAV